MGEEWLLRSSAALGYLGSTGGDREARFYKYSDPSDGFLAEDIALGLRRRDGRFELDFQALNAGRDDALYTASVLSLGLLRIDGFADALPHASMFDARTPYLGVGTAQLSLPVGFSLGGPARTQLPVPASHLSVQRDRSGIDVILTPSPAWRLSTAWRRDRRAGTRPTGGSMMFAFASPDLGSVSELIEPVEQITNDLSVRIAYATPRVQADVGYDYSRYEAEFDRLAWDNAFPVPAIAQGRLALAPDNHAHAIRGGIGLELPWRGRLTATAAWNRMEQDEALLPATINPALQPADDASALSRPTARAAVDLLVARGELQLRPWRPVGLRVAVRYESRDASTDYVSRLGDELGYVPEDGGVGRIVRRVGPAHFDREQLVLRAAANWRAARKLRLTLEYVRDARRRDARERNRTAENGIEIGAAYRGIEWMTARASYAFGRRVGSPYEPNPNAALFEAAGGAAPVVAPALRKPDVADRDRHDASLRLNFLVSESIDLSISGRFVEDHYEADLGLTLVRLGGANLEITHQHSPRLQLRLHAGFDHRLRTLSGVAATGTIFPLENSWDLESRAVTGEVGFGADFALFEAWRLAIDYGWSHDRESLSYAYATASALSPFGGVNPLAAGRGFPDLTSSEHSFESSLRWEPHERIAMKIFYRLRASQIDDFQQTGLVQVIDQRLFLGHVDGDFRAHVMGATAELRY